MSELREILERCMCRDGVRPTNEEIARAALLAEQENQRLMDKITRIKTEISQLETQDTSPEHDEGFADAIERALNCFEDWPDEQNKE